MREKKTYNFHNNLFLLFFVLFFSETLFLVIVSEMYNGSL